jgi:hypothetical protein
MKSGGEPSRTLLARVAFLELAQPVLANPRQFPASSGTLDAPHLAATDFLHPHGRRPRLASADERMWAAARAIERPLALP